MSALLVLKTFTKDTSHIGSNSQGYAVLLSRSRTWNQSEKDTILVNLDDEQEITQLPEQMHMTSETKMTMHPLSINILTMRKIQMIRRHCAKTQKQRNQQLKRDKKDHNDFHDEDEDLHKNNVHNRRRTPNQLEKRIRQTGHVLM